MKYFDMNLGYMISQPWNYFWTSNPNETNLTFTVLKEEKSLDQRPLCDAARCGRMKRFGDCVRRSNPLNRNCAKIIRLRNGFTKLVTQHEHGHWAVKDLQSG